MIADDRRRVMVVYRPWCEIINRGHGCSWPLEQERLMRDWVVVNLKKKVVDINFCMLELFCRSVSDYRMMSSHVFLC